VIRVASYYHVVIDYGGSEGRYERWTVAALKSRLAGRYGAVLLGDYDQVPNPYRQPGSSFMGDHSVYAHDYQDDTDDVCWHDPLRPAPIRVPMRVVTAYWQKPYSPVKGLAGFVRLPAVVSSYRVFLKAYAEVRVYDMATPPTATTPGVIRGWKDATWGPRASSAPCGPTRKAVYRKISDATVTLVTAGAFKGQWIRVGTSYGVEHRKVT
jgi:hypothetical protein